LAAQGFPHGGAPNRPAVGSRMAIACGVTARLYHGAACSPPVPDVRRAGRGWRVSSPGNSGSFL